jgi:hypothetical protein
MVSGMPQPVIPQALDIDFAQPLCPGVIDLVNPIQVVLQWDVIVNGDLILDMRFEPLEGISSCVMVPRDCGSK